MRDRMRTDVVERHMLLLGCGVAVLALLYRPRERSQQRGRVTLTVTLATLQQIRRGKKWYADDDEDGIVDDTRAKGSQGQHQPQQQEALQARLRALEQKVAALEHTGGSPTAAKRQQDKGGSGSNDDKLPMMSERSGSTSDLAARTHALEQRVAAAESAAVAAPAAARKIERKDGPPAPDSRAAGLTGTAAAVARMASNSKLRQQHKAAANEELKLPALPHK
eukprot:m51a1_g8236 hypothetical protein (222) ;mRNA; r:82363-83198